MQAYWTEEMYAFLIFVSTIFSKSNDFDEFKPFCACMLNEILWRLKTFFFELLSHYNIVHIVVPSTLMIHWSLIQIDLVLDRNGIVTEQWSECLYFSGVMFSSRPSPYVYYPFGIGHRSCIGRVFAIVSCSEASLHMKQYISASWQLSHVLDHRWRLR